MVGNINHWEQAALDQFYPEDTGVSAADAVEQILNPIKNTLFHANLYSSSQIDIIGILVQIAMRPNPQIDIGPIDCSVSVILCDLEQVDDPIVYASDAFLHLTGYQKHEVMNRNCRFLQWPLGGRSSRSKASPPQVRKDSVRRMRKAIDNRDEVQVEITNFRKNGEMFCNLMTIIPTVWRGHLYAVGLQGELY